MVSPGVTIDVEESLGRFDGRSMSISPSESAESEEKGSLYWIGAGGAGVVIEKGMLRLHV
jgi:hypothetical protein